MRGKSYTALLRELKHIRQEKRLLLVQAEEGRKLAEHELFAREVSLAELTAGLRKKAAMSSKKTARASNLTIRFYEFDGWDADTLKKYVKSGVIRSSREKGDPPSIAYFTLFGCQVDIPGLMQEISFVQRAFPDQEKYTDLEMLERQLT